ncbi:rhomboid family intramembrane serine protease [Synoicihabitans lomoniglobus]|uniref:Rhomboid family intramembrane serine protease n=1 Tax=Synoicihabitans lomoniglobus TaxID=2909285 RepID=A0AAF0CRA8_9BACT|nr:rhomboid family intramembrane serine protease [Opitutaceae bacterium LMO-M01]WED66516.1 rhomboid family intramembrane serine protease [Opitutaceae bacterium LMO-M01]
MIPLWDSHKAKRGGGVTSLLVTMNLLVFAGETGLALFDPTGLEALFNQFALVPSRWIQSWQTWRGWVPVFTAMFLHGSFMHVLGNMLFLRVFGRSLEDHLGSFVFLMLYLITGVGAAGAQVLADSGSAVPMIGASGAISGVLGAYLLLLPTRWIVALVPWIVPIVPIPALLFLAIWFAVQLTNGLGSLGAAPAGGVAWWAHAGGFVAGMVMAAMLRRDGSAKSRRGRRKD